MSTIIGRYEPTRVGSGLRELVNRLVNLGTEEKPTCANCKDTRVVVAGELNGDPLYDRCPVCAEINRAQTVASRVEPGVARLEEVRSRYRRERKS